MRRAVVLAVMLSAALTGSALAQDGRFDVGGGRMIRLSCQGQGAPTVVVDAGMGTAPVEDEAWRRIAARVSETARICLYDRAGLGASDPAPAGKPRTSADAAADLETALRAAKVAPPFLLAGHSIGGLHAQVFAARYPDQVAGLVLISSTHPDQMDAWLARLPAVAPGEAKALSDARGFLTRMPRDPSLNPENLDVGASNSQARALRSLGDKPVIVATHSPKWRMVPDLPEPLAVELEAVTQDLQKQFLTLSSRATQTIAPTAGHGLPHEDPGFVAEAILSGVKAVREGR
ncbi:alpha/beta fold hydrolase [Caulobacter endophyticus]|uniref:alpha/beta fold hydrolase n=1 Tax=Caulobacter endophyticus TaxID=2172652 RepID=UPI00240EF1BE|nr:alpha/beta hydrolase [Caulobacter endophyticus]MDG2528495.1 alpha/beta hydrolase [Caulobacter endophyticus]